MMESFLDIKMIGDMSVLKIDEGEGAGTQLFTLELRSRSHMGVV